MARIVLDRVGVVFPLFYAGDRSLIRRVASLRRRGGLYAAGTVVALDDVSLTLEPGERVALFGGNAAGKTTLLRVLAGLLHPTSGRAEIQGRRPSLIGAGFGMDAEFTVAEAIMARLLGWGASIAEARAVVDLALVEGGVADIAPVPLNTLSQGDLLRASVACAMAAGTDIMLLDEVAGHLAQAQVERLVEHIETRMDRQGIVVMVERTEERLLRLCDRALLLDHGRLAEDRPAAGDVAPH